MISKTIRLVEVALSNSSRCVIEKMGPCLNGGWVQTRLSTEHDTITQRATTVGLLYTLNR